MRRKLVLLSVLAAGLVGSVVTGGVLPNVAAQEGTPQPNATGVPAGITAELLSEGPLTELPSAGAALQLVRYELAPGASLAAEPNDPSPALIYVEQGTLVARADAPITVSSGPRLGTPLAEVAAGVEFRLEAGDTFAFPPRSGGEIRNDGRRPAVFLAAVVAAEQADGSPEAGTPTP